MGTPGKADAQGIQRSQGGLGSVFAFPNPVNEYAARITAGLVVLLAVATLLTGFGWGLATTFLSAGCDGNQLSGHPADHLGGLECLQPVRGQAGRAVVRAN